MHRGRRTAGVLFTLSLLILLIACGSGSARIRLINADPSQSSLDLSIDSKAVASAVAYGSASGYSSVSSGSRHLQVEASGTSNVISDQTISLSSASDTSVLFTNSGAMILSDNNSTPSSGNVSLRVINAASRLGTADVYVVAAGTNLATVSPTFSGLTFPLASAYTTIAAGSYQIIFTLPGQKFGWITSSSLVFSSGQVRTVIGLNGQTGGFTVSVLSDLN
jgi:Domain of unknown function (DUF4397)